MVKKAGSFLVNGLLLGVLGSLFLLFLIVSADLRSTVYTPEQASFLSYNESRMIVQDAAMWNYIQPGGLVAPALLDDWQNEVQATLNARYEEREGVTIAFYDLDFRSDYHLVYPGPLTTTVELIFPFPDNLETLHEVRFLVDGEEPADAQFTTANISWRTPMEAGEAHEITISYQASGVNSFAYGLNRDRRTDELNVTVLVRGLVGSEVPTTALPPTGQTAENNSETFTWNYTGLVASRDIEVELPARLSFAQRVAALQDDFRVLAGLAPFLVTLFLLSLAGLLYLGGIHLPLAGYLLLGCGLALFYPALTFLSGVIPVALAAAVALALVGGLVLLFLGLAAGWRQTGWRAGLLLIIFLGIFSLGMLTPWPGLMLTVGGLLLIGVFTVLAAPRLVAAPIAARWPVVEAAEPAEEIAPPELYCPHCGRELAEDHDFCPGCGKDTRRILTCSRCGQDQFVPAEQQRAYCINCGQMIT
jgi:hypothetical protein